MQRGRPRKRLPAYFFRTATGREPTREWILSLTREDRRSIGVAIRTVEYGWPIGMPLTRAMGEGLHELRIDLPGQRRARVFFYVDVQERLVILHGFIKKSRTTPSAEIRLARKRMKSHMRAP